MPKNHWNENVKVNLTRFGATFRPARPFWGFGGIGTPERLLVLLPECKRTYLHVCYSDNYNMVVMHLFIMILIIQQSDVPYLSHF